MAARRPGKEREQDNHPQSSQFPKILPPSMNPIQSQSPSQIVPFPRCSLIQLSNRLTPLGSTVSQIRPNYQSTLVSSYNPFQIHTQVTQTPISLCKSSPYLPKSNTHLFIVESKYDNIANPVTITKAYFPPNFHFVPQAPIKPLNIIGTFFMKPSQLKSNPSKTVIIPISFFIIPCIFITSSVKKNGVNTLMI